MVKFDVTAGGGLGAVWVGPVGASRDHNSSDTAQELRLGCTNLIFFLDPPKIQNVGNARFGPRFDPLYPFFQGFHVYDVVLSRLAYIPSHNASLCC